MKLSVWTDGSITKNPGGKASWAFVIRTDRGYTIKLQTGVVGEGEGMSVNVAEVEAIRQALLFLLSSGFQNAPIHIYTDSYVAQKAFTRRKPIKDGIYKPYADKLQQIRPLFKDISIYWIPREQNKEADALLR